MLDEELVNPEAFALAVRARASFLARNTLYPIEILRPYSQLTLLLDVELDEACEELRSRGLSRAYRWAMSTEKRPVKSTPSTAPEN